MILVTFLPPHQSRPGRPGILVGPTILDIPRLCAHLRDRGPVPILAGLDLGRPPHTMIELLRWCEGDLTRLPPLVESVLAEGRGQPEAPHEDVMHSAEACTLLAPVPDPPAIRDFYAFEQHVRTCRARRGLGMVPEWYEAPAFYFSNPGAICGPGDPIKIPSRSRCLDYELEIACIIGKAGRDIPAAAAGEYIAGYTILNDWSARDIQQKEMPVGLGPAKAKDFATSLGPWLVTGDALGAETPGGRPVLEMVARIDGVETSRGNLRDIHWTFAEMVEYASRDCLLRPGDILGSGTVGGGCLLEGGSERFGWLRPGQVVELEIEHLGVLRNTIVG